MKPLLGSLVVLGVSFASAAQADTLADIVAAYRKGVIYLRVEKAAENTGAVTEQTGTGFVLNKEGYVLTAAHVVSGGAGVQVNVRGAEGSREGTLEGMEVLYENSNFDVALLRFKNTAPSRTPVTIGDSWKVDPTATVFALGFPGMEEWFHTQGQIAGRGPKGSWNTTLVLNPGMSGGPVFGTDRKVIAIVWGGAPGLAGVNRVLPIHLLAEALRVAGTTEAGGTLANVAAGLAAGLIEVPYTFDQTLESMGGLAPSTKAFSRTFNAQPGFKIVDHTYVSKSANNASVLGVTVAPDGTSLTVSYTLKSGPVFDQWRGWIDAEVRTRQAPVDKR